MYRNAILAALCLFGSIAFASTPIASVWSSQPFTLDNHAISAAGVPSWPLLIGDELATPLSPALVLFKDGSRITLARNSRAKISGTSNAPVFLLVAGSIDYRLPKDSKLSVAKLQQPDKSPATPQKYSVTTSAKAHNSVPTIAAAASAVMAAPVAVLIASGHGASTTALTTTAATTASSTQVSTAGAVTGSTTTSATAGSASAAGSGSSVSTPTALALPPVSRHQ